MNSADKKLLFSLLKTPSPSGFEMPGQRLWADAMKKACSEVSCDAYGTTFAWLRCGKKNAPVLMLEAHSDEIGFMIKHISSEGFLRVEAIGGTDAAVARGRRLRFNGDKGEVLGITGNTAIHLRRGQGEEKAPSMHELFVDLGVSSAEEVQALGLRIGHIGVYEDGPMELSAQKIVGRALDNRVGSFILAQVAARLSKSDTAREWDVVFVNAVQEEIGGFGAEMITRSLAPQAALCFDVTHATDCPNIDSARFGDIKLGKGPTVAHGSSNHPLLVARLMDVADKQAIAYQHEATPNRTSTDTDSIFSSLQGVPAALLSLPLRYMHSPVETADIADIEASIAWISAFVESLKAQERFHHRL